METKLTNHHQFPEFLDWVNNCEVSTDGTLADKSEHSI